MNKNDLKTGMVVEMRNLKYMVINDYLVRNDGWLSLNGYGIDLKSLDGDEFWNITKVYKVKVMTCFKDLLDDDNLEIIWERKEKPKLSEDEKIILRNLSKEYKYIARDKNGDLYIYKGKPIKEAAVWCCSWCEFSYTHLFQMVQWSDDEPTLIEDLLRGE